MVQLPKITVTHAALHATVDITNLVMAVYRMLVRMVQHNVREGFHRRVQVAFGRAVQNAMQIRSAVAVLVHRAHQVSMSMAIRAKITAHPIVEPMGMHVPGIMQRQHAQAAVSSKPSSGGI